MAMILRRILLAGAASAAAAPLAAEPAKSVLSFPVICD